MLRVRSRLVLAIAAVGAVVAGAEPPAAWVDPDTGHRIVRLTREPGSASLYFNQNGYTADGKKMVYTTPDGIFVLDLQARAAKPVVQGRVRIIVTGRRTQSVYYLKEGAVYAADVDTGSAREIAKLPPPRSTRARWRWRFSDMSSGPSTARSSGTIFKLLEEKTLGSRL
jgi:oligogalacturonide lyase